MYNNPPFYRIINLALIVVVGVSVILLFLTFFGYGTLNIAALKGSVLLLNGKSIEGTTARIRTGSYELTMYSPRYETVQQTVHVQLWGTSVKPTVKQRSSDAILSSVIGANGLYGPPRLVDAQWVGVNWLVGSVGPGAGSPIALHFQGTSWHVAYYPVGQYPQNISTLPGSVASVLNQLEASSAN